MKKQDIKSLSVEALDKALLTEKTRLIKQMM